MSSKQKTGVKIKDLDVFAPQNIEIKGNRVAPRNPFTEFKSSDVRQSVSRHFEKQVKKFPQNTAVKTDEATLTYEELNRRSNRVARTLCQSCGRETEGVALLFEHGADMIVGIMGVLKSRKFYLPLDPTYPTTRLTYMLKDAGPKVLLTDRRHLDFARQLKKGVRDRLHIVDMDGVDARLPDEDLGLEADPRDPAYILYTSGSSGRPKGVLQDQGNVLHFIRVYTNRLHICPRDCLTLFSSYSFDAAVMDIFGALLNGAALYPFDVKGEGNFERLTEWMQEEKITIYHSIPTLYRYFTDMCRMKNGEPEREGKGKAGRSRGEFTDLRLIVLGGEAVFKRDIEDYREYFSPRCLFVNGLGPTESTVTLQYFLDRQTDVERDAVPVGFPVEETEVQLLGEDRREVPVYRPGEIVYCSPYLAPGYVNLPGLTADVFEDKGSWGRGRLFYSGDFGRRLEDGNIEFLGREDFQVKIRGYRVELGEIEYVLDRLPGVKKSVVTCRRKENGDNDLVAYYVKEDSHPVRPGHLKGKLGEALPEYMVPAVFCELGEWPRTPSGKIDRRNLPEPDRAPPDAEAEDPGPRNETEEKMADIWSQVLGVPVEKMGIDADFFALGGHSLKAIQIAARMEKQGLRVPINHIFIYPTIRRLAEQIELSRAEKGELISEPAAAEKDLKERLGIDLRLVKYMVSTVSGRRDPVFVLYLEDGALSETDRVLEAVTGDWEASIHPQYVQGFSRMPPAVGEADSLSLGEAEFSDLMGLKNLG